MKFIEIIDMHGNLTVINTAHIIRLLRRGDKPGTRIVLIANSYGNVVVTPLSIGEVTALVS